MTFLRNNTIWYSFHSKFATFRDFEKKLVFLPKKNIFFENEPKFFYVLRNFNISGALYGKFATL